MMSINKSVDELHKEIILELSQKNNKLIESLSTIIYSKRLLSDHVEILQDCIIGSNLFVNKKTHYFTLTKTIILAGSTFLVRSILNKSWRVLHITIPFFVCSYSVFVAMKHAEIIKNNLLKKRLQKLLYALDSFEKYIKENMVYLTEKQLLKRNSNVLHNLDNEQFVLRDCIQLTIEVIKILYEVVKKLEEYPLPSKFTDIYQPLEDLKDCEYFQKSINEFDTSNVKDFYNIYLYFQSQLLTRLSLAIIYNYNCMAVCNFLQNDLLKLIVDINVRINQGKNNNSLLKTLTTTTELNGTSAKFEKLSKACGVSSNRKLNYTNDSLCTLKSYSLGFSARLAAIYHECKTFDNFIQNIPNNDSECNNIGSPVPIRRQQLIDCIPIINNIEDALSICQDDYQRLTVAYHQFLHYKYKIMNLGSETVTDISDTEEVNKGKEIFQQENPFNSTTDNDIDENNEYFAIRNDENEFTADDSTECDSKNSSKNYNIEYFDEELKSLNLKMVKKHFKPVLKQLKHKINPIKKEMQERERNYLISKGIDPHKISESIDSGFNKISDDNYDDVDDNYSDNNDDDNDNANFQKEINLDDILQRCKHTNNNNNNNNNKYDIDRKLLQEKEQVSLFPSNFIISQNTQLHEDIIE